MSREARLVRRRGRRASGRDAVTPDEEAALIAELRGVLDRVDPPAPEVREFALAALGWRRHDAELAELLEDSALETEATAATRAGGATRRLVFRAEELTIDVEVLV